MFIEFEGKIKETKNTKGIWVNVLNLTLSNGEKVVLDRDETSYTIFEGKDKNGYSKFQMCWEGVYAYNSDDDSMNYNLESSMFSKIKSYELEIEDDAEEEYDLKIDEIFI